jgi:O-antigen/teichoic acid export membrane protein
MRGLSSSWFATLSTVVYGLLSVPLALHYLSVEEFGLFMLLIQIAGYFSLVEFGMAGALARILIDHKDDGDARSYGTVVLTGSVVLILQGAAVLLAGIFGASLIVSAAGVPATLEEPAVFLLSWLCASFAFATAFKALGAMLYANQRIDVLNLISAGGLLFTLVAMALVLALGGALRTLAVVFVSQVAFTTLIQALACWRLKLFPKRGQWGKPSLECFTHIFRFAKDVFVINIGNQLLEGSQLIIIARTMGLTSAAMWSVGTKLFNLFYQLLTRIEGTAVVFFSEMIVRAEVEKLANRFRQIYQLTAGLAAVSLLFAVAVNRQFVVVWAEPSLAWSLGLNVLLGALIFMNVITRCHIDFIIHTKRIGALRYVYFVEAVLFVFAALVLAPQLGFYGLLLAALGCLIFVRAWYTCWRTADYFRIPISRVAWVWLKPSLSAISLMTPVVATSSWIAACFSSPVAALLGTALWAGLPAAAILAKIALPRDIVTETRKTLAGGVSALFQKASRRCYE